MRYSVVLLSLGFLCECGFAQPIKMETTAVATPAVVPKSRIGTPEQLLKADVTDYIAKLDNSQNFLEPMGYVFGARMGYYGANAWYKNWIQKREPQKIVVNNINIDNIRDDLATATVTYTYQPRRAGAREIDVTGAKSYRETLTLKFVSTPWNESKMWQIVPPEKVRQFGFEKEIILPAAFALAQRDWSYTPTYSEQRSTIQLKQLTVAAKQFAQDFYGCYAFTPEFAQEALLPYLKSPQSFTIPNTEEVYNFNGYLSGKKDADIKASEKTVMFYEGEHEKPIFRYDGKAAIAYVDGHVKLVTPEEAAGLVWKVG